MISAFCERIFGLQSRAGRGQCARWLHSFIHHGQLRLVRPLYQKGVHHLTSALRLCLQTCPTGACRAFSRHCSSQSPCVQQLPPTARRRRQRRFLCTRVSNMIKISPFFFDRVDSIHAASFKVWNTWKYKMRSVRGQTSLERSAFSLPPHMNEPILTVAAERTSQLLPNHRFYAQHIILFSHSYHA